MKISPIMSQICQSRLSILPNKKKIAKDLLTFAKVEKFLQIWSHWLRLINLLFRTVSIVDRSTAKFCS